ncbi:uncharacterized protein [Apostichopus japonicus]
MPISSSRERLMPSVAEKPSAKSQPNVIIHRTNEISGKKHRKGNAQEKLTLPRINQLQINEQEIGQSQFHYGGFTSPTPKPSTPGHSVGRDAPKIRKGDKDFAFRKIRVFSKLPELEPLTLVFSTHNESLTHHDVLKGLQVVQRITNEDLKSIQFIDMNVVLSSAGVPGRWLIRVKNHPACQILLDQGITVKDERISLRRYDDVNAEDYGAFLKRKTMLESAQHSEIQKLINENLT